MYFALFACVFSPSPCEPSQHNTHKGRTDYDFCSRPPHFPSLPARRQLLRKKERKKEKTIRLLSSEPRAGKTSSKKKDNSRSSCSSSPFPSPLRHSPRTQQLYTYREYKRHGTAREFGGGGVLGRAPPAYQVRGLLWVVLPTPPVSCLCRCWAGTTTKVVTS